MEVRSWAQYFWGNQRTRLLVTSICIVTHSSGHLSPAKPPRHSHHKTEIVRIQIFRLTAWVLGNSKIRLSNGLCWESLWPSRKQILSNVEHDITGISQPNFVTQMCFLLGIGLMVQEERSKADKQITFAISSITYLQIRHTRHSLSFLHIDYIFKHEASSTWLKNIHPFSVKGGAVMDDVLILFLIHSLSFALPLNCASNFSKSSPSLNHAFLSECLSATLPT